MWRAAFVAVLTLAAAANAQASGPIALRGIDGVAVALDVTQPDSGTTVDTATLRTAVELRLREAGVPVKDLVSELQQGDNILLVTVVLLPTRSVAGFPTGYAFTAIVTLEQPVLLANAAHTPYFAGAWRARPGVFVQGNDADLTADVKSGLVAMIEEFANAYLAANPKR